MPREPGFWETKGAPFIKWLFYSSGCISQAEFHVENIYPTNHKKADPILGGPTSPHSSRSQTPQVSPLPCPIFKCVLCGYNLIACRKVLSPSLGWQNQPTERPRQAGVLTPSFECAAPCVPSTVPKAASPRLAGKRVRWRVICPGNAWSTKTCRFFSEQKIGKQTGSQQDTKRKKEESSREPTTKHHFD